MLEIRELIGRKELEQFVSFAIQLYEGNEYYVPPIIWDELNIMDSEKNPAFDFCEAVFYMAYREGKAVGRISGIVNHRFNELHKAKECRFSFVDFIDDQEVSAALIGKVEEWARSKGMETVVGPMGFTDLDYEGCLIEGFDQLSTASTIYNYPYYASHFERLGYRQDAIWNEYKMRIPDQVPEKHLRIAEIVKKKYGLSVIKPTNRSKLVKQYGQRLFELLNDAYAPLYGFCRLTQRQIDYYIGVYLPLVRLNCIRLIVDKDDTLVGFGITLPSMSKAQQKCQGKLFPLGWYYLLKALYGRSNKIWDLYLVGVRPDYQGKGVNALLFTELIPQARANGYEWAESNPELESNSKVQEQWQYFSPVRHKRRCSFVKKLV